MLARLWSRRFIKVACTATNWVHKLSGSGSPFGSSKMLPFSSHCSRGSNKKFFTASSAELSASFESKASAGRAGPSNSKNSLGNSRKAAPSCSTASAISGDGTACMRTRSPVCDFCCCCSWFFCWRPHSAGETVGATKAPRDDARQTRGTELRLRRTDIKIATAAPATPQAMLGEIRDEASAAAGQEAGEPAPAAEGAAADGPPEGMDARTGRTRGVTKAAAESVGHRPVLVQARTEPKETSAIAAAAELMVEEVREWSNLLAATMTEITPACAGFKNKKHTKNSLQPERRPK
mmetsp:Transcript_64632/g.166833  ORF Transcript_64632/g.166833 Transcript_64632/m.166833 type:complete len:293 (+) Transcript_64632:385-1263(+)